MTTENNKIIDIFNNNYLINLNGFECYYNKENRSYHNDWNLLMEVVEKIETKKYYKKEVQFSITKYSVKIQTLTSEDGIVISPCIFSAWGTYGGTEKIEAIYNACVEFIKWYNEQKKE